MTIAKAFFSVSATYAFGMAFSILANVLLARWMSVEDFGYYSFSISIATFTAIPVSVGLPLLLTREISQAVQDRDAATYRSVLTTAIVWVAGAAGVVLLAMQGARMTQFVSADMAQFLMIICFLPAAMGCVAICAGTLKGMNLPVFSEVLPQVVIPLMLVIGIVALKQTDLATTRSALSLHLIAYSIAALIGIVLVMRKSPIPLGPEIASVMQLRVWGLSFVSFTMIGGMATLSTQLATLLLGGLGQTQELAYLRVAERGAQLVAFPLMFINAIIGPYIVTARREEGTAALERLARDAARLSTLTSLPIAAVLIVFGKSLIGLTFGAAYVETAYLPMVIMSVGQVLSVAMGSAGMFLAMCGFEKSNLYGQGLSIVIILIWLSILTPLYGAIGSAIAVAMGMIALKLFLCFAVHRHLGFFPGVL